MKTNLQHTRTFLLGIFCLTLFVFSATAQQTKKISLQGFLKDANGKAVADGSQAITFKLYTTEVGGTAAWTDTQTINVFGGVYSTHLGSTTNPVDGLNWGSATYYVGVTVQGTELSPRTELTFAPYSLGSPKAQEVVCSGAVGDIKHSILDPDQFKAVNGNCWVPMDGRSMTGSKLATILNKTNVPDGGGLFIRSQEFPTSINYDDDRTTNSQIATFQGEDYRSHYHYSSLNISGTALSAGNHTHGYRDKEFSFSSSNFKAPAGGGEGNNDNYRTTDAAGEHTHSLSGTASGNTYNTGGNETRPDNLNFWVYIRIN